MFVFLKEKMKYPAVCTEDKKHWLLVGCTDEELNDFEKEYGLKRGEEHLYLVHHSDNAEYFRIACASLPQRLSPMFSQTQMPYESFYKMHKYFYKDSHRNLAVIGTYFGENPEENPFKIVNDTEKPGYMCLADIKLNG